MKKSRKISILLTFIGVLMIGSACLLEYIVFKEKPVVETKHHEKVTLKDMLEAKRKKDETNLTEKEIVAQEALEILPTVEEQKEEATSTEKIAQEEVIDVVTKVEEPVVFENMTLQELGAKLDRSLHSSVSGYGMLIATHALELGLDPYLAVAIMLHETGCKWNCSGLVKSCNNVGGQKGGPSCGGGAYKAYATLEEGIIGYMDNLYNNYYARGLTTVEAIGPRYTGHADCTTWLNTVQNYINQLRAA